MHKNQNFTKIHQLQTSDSKIITQKHKPMIVNKKKQQKYLQEGIKNLDLQ